MKTGLIKGINPTPESKINSNAILKGLGIGLTAAVVAAAAVQAAVKKTEEKENGTR